MLHTLQTHEYTYIYRERNRLEPCMVSSKSKQFLLRTIDFLNYYPSITLHGFSYSIISSRNPYAMKPSSPHSSMIHRFM